MRDVVFISLDDERILVGWGPFTRERVRLPGRLAFYVNDFFRAVAQPWIYPESTEILSVDEMLALLGRSDDTASGIEWSGADRQLFDRLFDEAHSLIEEGVLQKAVVLSKEQGSLPVGDRDFDALPFVVTRLQTVFRRGLRWYGFKEGTMGFVGLTPETLFESRDGKLVETAALAGTVKSGDEGGFASDPKELEEHLLVVRDIKERLVLLGEVRVDPLSIVPFGHLSHLRSAIACCCANAMPFETLCAALHPTAALGVYPRTVSGDQFLRHQETLLPRGFHGSPFGFEQDSGSPRSLCLVAIRNVQWADSRVIIVGGAGVVKQSIQDEEWEECELKRSHLRNALSGAPHRESESC